MPPAVGSEFATAPAPQGTSAPAVRGGVGSEFGAPRTPTAAPPAAPTPAPSGGIVGAVKGDLGDIGTALATPTKPQSFSKNLSDTFNGAVDNVNQLADHWSGATALQKTVSVGQTGLDAVNILFSPITAALNSASGIPVVGKIADGVNRVFAAIGAGGGDLAGNAVDALPISQEHKDTIRPLVKELGALAAQMLVGGKAGAVAKFGLDKVDTATGGYGKAALSSVANSPVGKTVATGVAKTNSVLKQNVIDPKHTTLFASKAKALAGAINDAVVNHPDVKAAQESQSTVTPTDTSGAFAKSKAAVPNLGAKVKTMNPVEMPPELRQDIRTSIKTNGPDATHVALKEQFNLTDQQAEHFVREAPAPQTPAEHAAALDRVKAAVDAKHAAYAKSQGYEPYTPHDQLPTIEAGAAPKSDLPAIQTEPPAAKPVKGDFTIEPIKEPVSTSPKDTPTGVEPTAAEPKPVSEMTTKELKIEKANTEPLKTEPGVSRVGKSIEAKAIEAKITEGFPDTAHYDVKTFKDAAEKTANLINSGIDNARAVVRGEAPRPEGITTGSLIAGIEEYAKKNPEHAKEILSELVNSPLASETSVHAQETGSLRMREQDSVTKHLQEIKKGLVEKSSKVRDTIKRQSKDVLSKTHLPKDDLKWEKFLSSITC